MKKSLFIAAIFPLVILFFTACSGNGRNAKMDQLEKDEMYTCTMHNEVMSDNSGKCPKCGMALMKQKMTNEQMEMMKEGTYTKPEN